MGLLQRERTARASFYEGAKGPHRGRLSRRWWKAVEDLLAHYVRSVSRTDLHYIDEKAFLSAEPPVEVLNIVAKLIGYLAVGKMPDPISLAIKKGRTGPGPEELRDIGLAVVYRRACTPEGFTHMGESIRIDDARPVVTLTQWYGVSRRTIQMWVASYQPAFLGINRVNASTIKKLAAEAGARYCTSGRSHHAIRKRSEHAARGARK